VPGGGAGRACGPGRHLGLRGVERGPGAIGGLDDRYTVELVATDEEIAVEVARSPPGTRVGDADLRACMVDRAREEALARFSPTTMVTPMNPSSTS